MKPTDYEFADELTFALSHGLVQALDAALDAMTNYGSDTEHMLTLSALKIVAMRARKQAMDDERNKS